MDYLNPLEVLLVIALVLFSIWMLERIIAGAFKTVIISIIIALIFMGVTYHKGTKKVKPLPHFTLHDLTDYNSFKKKFTPYEKETVKDIKADFFNAEKDVKGGK